MKSFWKNWKKPLLAALLITAGDLLLSMVLIRFSGWIFAPLLGDFAAPFRQLLNARIGWSPLAVILPIGAALLLKGKYTGGRCVWVAAVGLLAALLLLSANGIPFFFAARAAIALLG